MAKEYSVTVVEHRQRVEILETDSLREALKAFDTIAPILGRGEDRYIEILSRYGHLYARLWREPIDESFLCSRCGDNRHKEFTCDGRSELLLDIIYEVINTEGSGNA
jgi:hypothetical protein